MAIVTMDMILKAVLSAGNKEQNQAYPPAVFEAHFNLVSSYLLDEIAKLDPTSRSIVDMGKPFFESKLLPVKGGLVEFPTNYRNLRGVAVFVTTSVYEGEGNGQSPTVRKITNCCGKEVVISDEEGADECTYQDDPLANTEQVIRNRVDAGKCRSMPVRMVDQDEWDLLTTHPYKFPTLTSPIGCIFQGEGIRICPFNIPNVELRYIRQPRNYVYSYTMQPDDTYVFSEGGSTESEWQDNAKVSLFKGISTLYAIYTSNGEMRDGILELKKAGIF